MTTNSTDISKYGEKLIFKHPIIVYHRFFTWFHSVFPVLSLTSEELEECQMIEYMMWNAFALYTAYEIKVER